VRVFVILRYETEQTVPFSGSITKEQRNADSYLEEYTGWAS